MTDECVDESDGLDGRMNDCLSNCCRDVSSYLVWLILCIVLVTTAVCDALLGLVPHIRVHGYRRQQVQLRGAADTQTEEV